MTRVSSGAKKSGPPAHANRFAFVHNPSSRLTKKILSTPISGLCPPCTHILEWRKRYRKYKPLSVAKKCVRCGGKRITEAYHVVCGECAKKDGCCGKCLLKYSEWRQVDPNQKMDGEDQDKGDDADVVVEAAQEKEEDSEDDHEVYEGDSADSLESLDDDNNLCSDDEVSQ